MKDKKELLEQTIKEDLEKRSAGDPESFGNLGRRQIVRRETA